MRLVDFVSWVPLIVSQVATSWSFDDPNLTEPKIIYVTAVAASTV